MSFNKYNGFRATVKTDHDIRVIRVPGAIALL